MTTRYDENEELSAEEERRVWKKNSELLYDFGVDHTLEWSSLTAQWLPEPASTTAAASEAATISKLLLGTQADGSEEGRNYLLIAEVALPQRERERDFDDLFDRATKGFGKPLSRPKTAFDFSGRASEQKREAVRVVKRIPHRGDVNRARYMPQQPSLVATKSPNPEVFIFDLEREFAEDEVFSPLPTLKGHTGEGFGLSWNALRKGLLASASLDGSVCLWDVNREGEREINALHKLSQAHEGGAEDVDWNPFSAALFASVGDDRRLCLWDVREKETTKTTSVLAHDSDVHCVSFCPFDEFSLATGGADAAVKLWDTRSLSSPVHSVTEHDAPVYQLSWSTQHRHFLASSSEDAQLIVWDWARIGREQSPEDAEDGPPELLHVHRGHTAKIFDLAWHPTRPYTLASVAENNSVQVWTMSEVLVTEEEGDEGVDDDDLEGDDDEDEDEDDEEDGDNDEDNDEEDENAKQALLHKKQRTH